MPRSFSMWIIWKILTRLPFSPSLMFIALFQNQVEQIFPVFFNWQHTYASWWFLWQMLSDTKSLSENFRLPSNLFQRFSLSTSTLCLWFLHSSSTITDSFFLSRMASLLTCLVKSSGLTSCPVKECALQMFGSCSLLLIHGGTRFTLTNFCRWY